MDYGALSPSELQKQQLLEKYGTETTEPRHLFLGVYPLTFGVQIICFFHLLWAAICISCASSVLPFTALGLEVYPMFQVLVATWSLMGIAIIIGALIATVTHHRTAIAVYKYYLMITCVMLLLLLIFMVYEDSQCAMIDRGLQTERIGVAFPCAMVTALCFFTVLGALGLTAYGTFIVSELNDMKNERADVEHALVRQQMRKMGKDLALKEQLAPKTVFTSKPYKMEGKQAKAAAAALKSSKSPRGLQSSFFSIPEGAVESLSEAMSHGRSSASSYQYPSGALA
mmetsp:Transcript_65488/g.122198  ORF Transcript_65488/g.122198 Transcript_65488/m.122198 type:complete len:284 (-) Transcript_65488:52-903(-)